MREFTCVFCGKKSIDKSVNHLKMFCSSTCRMRDYNQRHKYDPRPEKQECKYNDGVECLDSKCANCGWNPEVAKKRTEEFL